MLAVVREKKERAGSDRLLERVHQLTARLLANLEHRCRTLRHEHGVRERCQLHEPDPIRVRFEQVPSDLEREARLAAAARAGERDQASRAEEAAHLLHLIAPADEAGQERRQVVGHA